MTATYRKLLAIALAGLLFRLLLLQFVQNPGLHDPLHYYNLGSRLNAGYGFTIDYIWHYSRLPDSVTHPIDHWLPMAGVAAALGMRLLGEGVLAAASIFVLAGALLPLLTFFAAQAMRLSSSASLLAAAFTAFLPDLVWNSLRADTTILNALFIGVALLLLAQALSRKGRWLFLVSGIFAGLAYLTRSDSLLFLPLAAVCCIVFRSQTPAASTQRETWMSIVLVALGFMLVAAPWLMRNLHEFGAIGSPETDRMFFMVAHHDHYAWGMPITLDSMLERKSIVDLLAKRAFEFLAAIKQIIVSLDFPLFLFGTLGAFSLLRQRKRATLLYVIPPLLWLGGILLFYPLLLPMKSQAGSFEKALLTITPLLMPLCAYAIERFCRHRPLRFAVIALTLFIIVLNAFTQASRETAFADRYYASIQVLVDKLETLPDETGDGRIRLMTQDPYVFSYFGYQSIMIPYASRDDTLELARRYAIDYLMLPPGRPQLDALYLGREIDARFELVAHLSESGPEPFELYRFIHE